MRDGIESDAAIEMSAMVMLSPVKNLPLKFIEGGSRDLWKFNAKTYFDKMVIHKLKFSLIVFLFSFMISWHWSKAKCWVK